MPADPLPLAPLLAQQLRLLVADPRAVVDLRRYFGIGLPPGQAAFTGSRFEQLAGGGDRPEIADQVTAEDLVAVQTLSVTVPAEVALDLLEGELGAELSDLLRQVPTGVELADAAEAEVRPGSPAFRAWQLLEAQPGVGWVIAGKVLARKRPHLLPVYDRVVRCALGSPRPYWLALHAALRENGRALHRELLTLARAAGVPETIGALRVCDVVVWMAHRTGHRNCS